ncbi:MAG: DUF2809 domain-containing protein [Lachnospiraceae bacterium]|nr:DUF2809 domain-containing protein [Lachnospiraceae bacterium]
MKKRITYTIITIMLLTVEVLIALFIHDDFVRPYIGDVLVVMVLYTFIRIFVPEKIRMLPSFILCFAVLVEVMQYFRIVEVLGLQDNRFLSVLIGSVFDIKDIICYAVGCILIVIGQMVYKMSRKSPKNRENSDDTEENLIVKILSTEYDKKDK